jgi:DNA-binding NtrC family response regulator
MAAESSQIRGKIALPSAEYIFGSTPGMRTIRSEIERALQDNLPVLIEGEHGTGKELIARFLHSKSDRSEGPFVKVNCGAAPVGVLEAEIFGSDVGVVESRQAGQRNCSFEMASGGTLFLDEIGDLGPALQQRLANAIKSGQYGSKNGGDEGKVRVRIVCASDFDLQASGQNGMAEPFDLLGCFGHRVRLLPLRERKEDIPQLCRYLGEKIAHDFGRPVPRFSARAIGVLQRWDWPGNIRELENWTARIVIFGAEEVIGPEVGYLAAGVEAGPRPHRATHGGAGRSRRMRGFK